MTTKPRTANSILQGEIRLNKLMVYFTMKGIREIHQTIPITTRITTIDHIKTLTTRTKEMAKLTKIVSIKVKITNTQTRIGRTKSHPK